MTIPELWDWRREVAALYAAVRAQPNPEVGWHVWRQGRDALYRTHPQSPLEPDARRGFAALPFFAYDPALRVPVGLVPSGGGDLDVTAGEDGPLRLRPFARTQGLSGALGTELTLYWIVAYGGGVLLPFADATSGQETYGGGRYLLDTIKGADLGAAPDGRTVLDFNFAYNPSCAYSPRYVCPLAPPGNRLPEAVRAGERA